MAAKPVLGSNRAGHAVRGAASATKHPRVRFHSTRRHTHPNEARGSSRLEEARAALDFLYWGSTLRSMGPEQIGRVALRAAAVRTWSGPKHEGVSRKDRRLRPR